LACPENNLAAEIVRSAGAGEVVNPTVADLLAAAERLRKDDQARELYSKRARSYAERTFAIESIAQKFLEVFEFACKSTGRIVPARGLRAAAAGFGR
jgi:glycosyltransferase involved in cell wall biosynthesis